VNNASFPLNVLLGVDTDEDPDNNFTGDALIDVNSKSYLEDGVTPLISFPNATIESGVLDASDGTFSLDLGPGELVIPATLYNARITGTVNGDFAELVDGFVAGAARRDEVIAAIEAIPEDQLPLPVDDPEQFVDTLLGPPDIDTDDDGTPDAFSISFSMTAISVQLGDVVDAPLPVGGDGTGN